MIHFFFKFSPRLPFQLSYFQDSKVLNTYILYEINIFFLALSDFISFKKNEHFLYKVLKSLNNFAPFKHDCVSVILS